MGVELEGSGQGRPRMNPDLATPLLVMGAVLVLLCLYRTIIRVRHHQRLREILLTDDQRRLSNANSFCILVKKHVIYAPLFRTRHSREFRLFGRIHMGTMPLRREVAFLLGYIALNILFFFVTVDWWEVFPEKMYQLKYAAGHLAVMNLPGLVLTAGRNNPLIPLLGFSFDTFNLMHRWIGRIVAVEAVVHMACVLASMVHEKGWDAVHHIWNAPFFIFGSIALVGFVIIFFQAMSPIRHAFYEFFLHTHILLAVVAFVALWYHLKGLTQQYVLLVALVFWGLDRLARIGILLWRNCGKRGTTATVEFLPGSVARVDVAVARNWNFKAGQYIYLYIPLLGLWTSHPFSVAWTSTERSAPITEKRNSSDSFNGLLGGKERTTMSFLIKSRDGFTKKLLEKAEKSAECPPKVTALAEGPFGGLHSLASYGTVLLIAGGIGITHPMSYLHQFVNGFTARSVATRRVTLIWMVRSLDHLTWIQPWMTSLFAHSALNGATTSRSPHIYFQFPAFSLSIHIFLTSTSYRIDDSFPTSETPWTHQSPPSVPVTINCGKPSLKQILETEKAQQVGAMAVSVCGPGGLGDDVREAVRNVQGGKVVDLYEESFSW